MSNLLQLLHISDPTLPIGGFSHSAALETYVQKRIVVDSSSAKAFITQMLSSNLQYTDAAFLSMAFDAATKENIALLIALDDECTAVKLPAEMRMASKKLGLRLLKIFHPLLGNHLVNAFQQQLQNNKIQANYAVVFGLLSQVMHITKKEALLGFYYNAAAGFITNSVKLVPLGQQQGQEILFSLQPLINQLAEASMQPDKHLIGLCCPGFDIRSMQHERLYSRLYMS